MLEVSILSVIAVAAAYWTALWWMGRHEDVLYGGFVTHPVDTGARRPPEAAVSMLPAELPRRPQPAQPPAVQPSAPVRPLPAAAAATVPATRPVVIPAPPRAAPAPMPAAATQPPPLPKLPPSPAPFRKSAPPATEPDRTEVLASLLESIKRDLGAAR